MKKLITIGALILSLSSAFADCGCKAPTFNEDNETDAILGFMLSKLLALDVRDITLKQVLPYMTYSPERGREFPSELMMGSRISGGIVDGVGFINRPGPTRCQVTCANKRNSVRKYVVEFVKEARLCAVDLKVTMLSKRRGFKSIVAQKNAPICE